MNTVPTNATAGHETWPADFAPVVTRRGRRVHALWLGDRHANEATMCRTVGAERCEPIVAGAAMPACQICVEELDVVVRLRADRRQRRESELLDQALAKVDAMIQRARRIDERIDRIVERLTDGVDRLDDRDEQ